jgi:nucleoside-diphosphate-sugar epimerase
MTGVVVTGANGFIGAALCRSLVDAGHAVTGTVRTLVHADISPPCRQIAVGDIDGATNWFTALKAADAVVHLAAQVPEARVSSKDARERLRRVNVQGAENLARHAATASVRRMIYVSSVKVHGEHSGDRPFTADDPSSPEDAYARSKAEAEQALLRVTVDSELELVIVRSPLVYGPGVKGNFLRLMRLVDKGWPLPLKNIDNRRSLIALDNLIDLLGLCIQHPAAAGHTFLASDGEDLSTPQLMRRIARAMRRPLRLWPMPPALLRATAATIGKREWYDRLCGSLQVDDSQLRQTLGWRPPVPMEEALSRTVEWYLKTKTSS